MSSQARPRGTGCPPEVQLIKDVQGDQERYMVRIDMIIPLEDESEFNDLATKLSNQMSRDKKDSVVRDLLAKLDGPNADCAEFVKIPFRAIPDARGKGIRATDTVGTAVNDRSYADARGALKGTGPHPEAELIIDVHGTKITYKVRLDMIVNLKDAGVFKELAALLGADLSEDRDIDRPAAVNLLIKSLRQMDEYDRADLPTRATGEDVIRIMVDPERWKAVPK
jgi:hypothetical protein